MLSTFLSSLNFHQCLQTIDQDLAEQTQAQGCIHCGARLHQANYPRKPSGLTNTVREYYQQRNSFCCSSDGCRKRTTPPSVRFLGCLRFVAAVVIFIAALQLSANEKRCQRIQKLLGIKISKRTWQRWSKWWRESFKETLFWRSQGALPIDETKQHYPREFLKQHTGTLAERMVGVLQFLAPMTAGAFRAV